jgi:hypothetical protein
MRVTLLFCAAVLVTALSLLPYQLAQAQTAGFDVFTAPFTPGSSIPAGSTYTIKWTPSSPTGTISLVLLQGSSITTVQLGPTIACKYLPLPLSRRGEKINFYVENTDLRSRH